MKHIVAAGPRHNIFEELPMPVMNDDQILIHTKYMGVCMSEHYGWATAKAGDAFGHEPLGIIECVGKNVRGYKVGDHVSGWWGSSLPGGGGMSEYVVTAPGENVIVLPDNVPDEDILLEPLSCMMSAVSKARISMPGTEVCVVGAGYMGCGAISLLKLRGAIVTAVDMRPQSRHNAKKYGGADYVYSVEEMEEKLANGFEGFEVVMEWGETNESLDLAARLTKQCGQLCIGAYHTGEKRLIDMQLLNVRAIDCLSTHPRETELSLKGARNAARMLSEGRWNYMHIPTMVYPMSRFDQAQADLETKFGHHMKAIIDMRHEDFEPYLIYEDKDWEE
ncbi:MAG: alcohol dehydrogenase catalytic domain-containing protein [Clostridia bacterium]|nr:alcohol dehydrogenase catalytic domain-containing protein [Clostridia bacterium]